MRNGRKIVNYAGMNERFFWNFIWREGDLNRYGKNKEKIQKREYGMFYSFLYFFLYVVVFMI